MHGESILQTVQATGIFGDIAANTASDLGRWIRCVVEPVRAGRLRDGQIAHARLNACRTRAAVDVDDAVELREAQNNPTGQRQCAAGKTGSRTACNHRDLKLGAQTQCALHLLDGFGQRHEQGQLAVGGQAITLIGT